MLLASRVWRENRRGSAHSGWGRIGANAVISEGAFICTASHDIRSEAFELVTKPVEIGDSAWIAARAIVLPGRKVGEGAVVAAGAVVARDVEPDNVVAGNPARVI